MESDWHGANSTLMVAPDPQFISSMAKKLMVLNQIDIVVNRSHVTGLVQECLSDSFKIPEVKPEVSREWTFRELYGWKMKEKILMKNDSKKGDFLERKKRLKDKD